VTLESGGQRCLILAVGVRRLDQLDDVLRSAEIELSSEHLLRLDEVSPIDLGFPYSLLQSPLGQLVHGDTRIELPPTAPYRRRR
jgi:hypothetical protein